MSEAQQESGSTSAKEKGIEVTVTFPLAQGQPFHAEEAPESTVEQVREQAMNKFGIQQESSSTYYLTHGGARSDDGATLASIAGPAHGLKFTLVKELVQG